MGSLISKKFSESLFPDRKLMSSSLEMSKMLLESVKRVREVPMGVVPLDASMAVPLGGLLSCFMAREDGN